MTGVYLFHYLRYQDSTLILTKHLYLDPGNVNLFIYSSFTYLINTNDPKINTRTTIKKKSKVWTKCYVFKHNN